MTNPANKAQVLAARPDVSTWLSANAGSGKTRVLTNRVARLLLHGTQPQNILCLTYTKAAASEMQNRLFATLGKWAMMQDKELSVELASLGEPRPEDLGRARTLFAGAIETPGGLKIQTIHSFCSTILRQFPLEAGVNPQFREMDEAAQSALLGDVMNILAEREPEKFAAFASLTASENLADLTRALSGQRFAFNRNWTKAEIRQAFSVPGEATEADVLDRAISEDDIVFLKSLIPVLKALGSSQDQKLADGFEKLAAKPTIADLKLLESILLFGKNAKSPFAAKPNIPTKDVRSREEVAPLLPEFFTLAQRVEVARKARIALKAADETYALHAFAKVFFPAYEAEKATLGVLDFDDLILKARELLTNQSLAWVMYRLDSRIQHILVDEAQDTSPLQWDIVGALTEELSSGDSDTPRTLFVVGDKKQSIYSFQGADAAGFDRRAEKFRSQKIAGRDLAEGALEFSFRSSPAILQTVDRVFAAQRSDGLGEFIKHEAFHEAAPGRVDVWPLVPAPEKRELPVWSDTSLQTAGSDPVQILAKELAQSISNLLKDGSIPDKNGGFRRVQAGDIMVLVQRRSALFDKIIAECKALNLDIAGADRLKVSAELAVRDLLALLSFLSLPEDSLSLATALRSPLFGLSENELFELAAKRPKGQHLWQALRQKKGVFEETYLSLEDLRSKVDFLRPFELLEYILRDLSGRSKLLSRLGSEAEEGIDELLNQALLFEKDGVPSLTGFLSKARASEHEVKRDADTSGNLIRVMTVHGAKGLESPIVILPDTTVRPQTRSSKLIPATNGLQVVSQNANEAPPIVQEAKARIAAADRAERDRLLYVAMTRAECWLIVCGVSTSSRENTLDWHSMVSAGVETSSFEEIETPFGAGMRFAHGIWKNAKKDHASEANQPVSDLPAALPENLPPVVREKLASPSDLGGAKVIYQEGIGSDGGRERGNQLHLLLEHLPNKNDPIETAKQLLLNEPFGQDMVEITQITDHVLRIFDKHAELFTKDSLAEVEVSAFSPTLDRHVFGTIDRLIVKPSSVLAVDFKSNVVVPTDASRTPEGILRQMGAYLEVLEGIYPDRPIRLAILWTTAGQLMELEHGIVRDALARATTS